MGALKYYNTTTSQWEYLDISSYGENSFITKEVPSGLVNGTNTTFITAEQYVPGSLEVYINGLRQGIAHVTETTPSTGTFTLDAAPSTGDVVEVSYQFAAGASGNADTVDGFHASVTPTANQLMPLGSDAKFSASVMPTQEAWIPVTFQNSWVDFGGTAQICAYMKDSMGFVHLKGLAKSGTINATMFTLPVGYRPLAYARFLAVANAALANLDIPSTGEVRPATGSNVWFSLDGITFRAEA